MGNPSVCDIMVLLAFVVLLKALSKALLSVVASPLAILPPPPPYSVGLDRTAALLSLPCTLLPLLGRHSTSIHQLAHYCYSPASTILLIIVGWHPFCSVAPLATLPFLIVGFPRLRRLVVLHCLQDLRQRLERSTSPGEALFVSCWPTLWVSQISVSLACTPSPNWAFGSASCVQRRQPKGFGSLSCMFLWIVALRVWGITILGARREGLFLCFRGVWFFPIRRWDRLLDILIYWFCVPYSSPCIRPFVPITRNLSRSPDDIRVGITLVFFSLLHGCNEGFPL